MRYFGIAIIVAGVLLLASHAFSFHFHWVFESYPWLGFIPVGLGLLCIVFSDKGVGA